MPAEVVIVRTGTANLASVIAAFERLGEAARITDDPSEVADATRLVLPGVGTLAAAMASLRERRLVEVLRDRLRDGRPALAICLGLQLLCEGSAESPGERGLCIVPTFAERFTGVRTPHMGWSRVGAIGGTPGGFAYFAHSYRLTDAPPGWNVSRADHGGAFVGAMFRGAILACQFHPELSGAWGAALLRGWLSMKGGE